MRKESKVGRDKLTVLSMKILVGFLKITSQDMVHIPKLCQLSQNWTWGPGKNDLPLQENRK